VSFIGPRLRVSLAHYSHFFFLPLKDFDFQLDFFLIKKNLLGRNVQNCDENEVRVDNT
jgi:hypothetical protein